MRPGRLIVDESRDVLIAIGDGNQISRGVVRILDPISGGIDRGGDPASGISLEGHPLARVADDGGVCERQHVGTGIGQAIEITREGIDFVGEPVARGQKILAAEIQRVHWVIRQ